MSSLRARFNVKSLRFAISETQARSFIYFHTSIVFDVVPVGVHFRSRQKSKPAWLAVIGM